MLAARLLLAPLSLALVGQAVAADWILPAPVGTPAVEARSLRASATLADDSHLDVVLSLAMVAPQEASGTLRLDVGSLEQASATLAGQPLAMSERTASIDLEAGEAVIVELRGRLSPDRLDWLSEGEAGWFGRSRGPVLQPMNRLIVRHRDDSAFATAAMSLQVDVGDVPMTGILATPGARLAHGSARWESLTLPPPARISVAWPVLGGGSFLPRTSAEAAEAIVDWQARVVEAADVRRLATAVVDAAASADDEPAARAAAASLSEHARTLEQRATATRRVADATQPAGSEGPAPAQPAVPAQPAPAPQVEATPPDAAQRDAAQREAAQREAAQREAAQREAAQREAAQREAAQREAAQREAAQREAAQRETAQREAAQREAAQREAAQREAAQRESAEREAAQREAAEREAAQRESAQREAAQRESAQREAAEREAAQREAAQRESAQREAAEREAAQREAAHLDAAQRAERQLEATRRAHELAAAETPEPTADVPWITDVAQARLFLAAERHVGLRRERIEEAIAIMRAHRGDPFDEDPLWRERFENEPWYAPRDPDGLLANAPETDAALTLLRQAI